MSQMAINDLESIWNVTLSNNCKEKADILYTLLISQIKQIASNFTVGKSIENTREGYRVHHINNHLIYYRADLENRIEVMRILNK